MTATADALILYVDDEWTNRTVFERSLENRFKVRSVASAEEALQILASEKVAVLVTDQRMPGMNGNDLLRLTRERHPAVVRIVLTAYDDIDPILRAVNEGLVARYLVKPFERSELLHTMAWALETWQLGGDASEVQLRLLQTERLATIGTVAAGAFHDLGNLVAPLRVNSDRIDELLGLLKAIPAETLDADSQQTLAEAIEDLGAIAEEQRAATNVMQALSASFRNLARSTPAAADVDPVRVIDQALGLFRSSASLATLVRDVPATLPSVRINASELLQILVNLIRNSIEALGEKRGSITLSASTAVSQQGETLVRIAVRDDGAGMAPDTLEKAGKVFFTTRPEGTGLGLANCRRLAERAGGSLTIESELGRGTTVSISLRPSPRTA